MPVTSVEAQPSNLLLLVMDLDHGVIPESMGAGWWPRPSPDRKLERYRSARPWPHPTPHGPPPAQPAARATPRATVPPAQAPAYSNMITGGKQQPGTPGASRTTKINKYLNSYFLPGVRRSSSRILSRVWRAGVRGLW
jgi:hypothetical protein